MDEEAILGGLRSGEDLPDFDYEDFEAGSTGQDRRGEDPGRDTPRGRGRYADDGDDRIFRQATDDEQTRRVYSDRSGSESGHRRGHFDFVSMAMDMARPHLDDPEAMPIRPPRSLVPGESQVSDEFESRPQGPGTMVLVPGGIPGRSTGSQNPGQFDEHEERKFSDFGYDDLLKSTAGWGSSSKQGSDAGRPNPDTAKSESYDDEGYNFADEEESHSRRNAGSRATARTRPAAAKVEVDDDDEYAAFADRRDEEEDQPRRNARIRDAARPRSLSRGAARDLRVDRDARSERERARDSREVLRGLEAIHDREGPVGPPAIGDTPNVPRFPNITFGGPLNQRDVSSNRVTGSPRITERAADVIRTGAGDGRLADALGIEERPSIASPLGRDTSDLETLRSSNEFTPQWGSTARERSASAKRPSPLAIETDRSKARRASPSPMDLTPQDEEMPDPADVHIHSTPESRASHVDPRSGDSRRRGSTPSRPSGIGDSPMDEPRSYARASGAPERIEISTPPALRSHSSGESGDARAKEVFDLHIQEMLERGEVSGSVAKAFHIFADQIRVLNGQVSSMRREWSDESRQTKDKVDRLAAEIATQSDAGRMKMIVQRFAREVIPDSKAIVRQAIDEQAEVVEQRINLLSHEVHESVKDNEASTDRLRQMIQENRQAVHRSHAASEDEILKDLDKLGKRVFSIEKTVGMRTQAGVWNPNPVAHLPDRASGSMVDANFRELNLKIEKALLEHETFAKWASESIKEINEEHTRLATRVSRLQSGRGSQEVDRPSERESPQDWHEAVDEINRKMQDLARGIQRQRRDHDDIISRFETVKSHVEQYEARSAIVNRVVDNIQGQIRNLPASSDQMQPAVRRELGSLRSTLEGVMRRVSAIDGNVRTLGAANNRIMSQLFEMEGQFDEAAGIIQGVQQINEAPQQPREGRNVGYNAFAGQGHRIRSPTPTPGESDGRGTGGVGLSGQVVPNVPDRVDPSRADRHPIYPVRERSDSRSRRVRGLPDRSHSPPGRARDDPRARVRGDVSVSPNRNVSRNRSPRPDVIPDRRSEVRSRQPRGERPIRDSGSISPNFDRPIRDSGNVSPSPGRHSGGGGDNRVHADIQSPGDEWRTPGSRASVDIQSPGDRRGAAGAPSNRGQASAPAARGAPGGDGPDTPKICALDDPNDRRHPNAEFSCVTCSREFCGLCRGDDGDCCNCHFLKMKCWACRKNAQEVSMYLCTDCGTHVCENHSYFGNDGLERCARCNIRHERAQAGPPPPPPPGGGGGQGGPPGQGGSGSVVMDMFHFHHLVLDILVGAKVPLDLLEGRVEGLLPGDTQVEHPGSVVVLPMLNGPAYGGGVSHQEIGAGVSQYSNATGYPSSVASGGNLGPGLSLGYSVSGAGRQGDGGLLPEALRGDDGRDRCTKCNRIPEPGFPLVPRVG